MAKRFIVACYRRCGLTKNGAPIDGTKAGAGGAKDRVNLRLWFRSVNRNRLIDDELAIA
jgi:hypothetical protein